MSNLLHLEFHGLTGIVPLRDVASENPAERYLFVLPDLRVGLPRNPLPVQIAPHVPAAIVPSAAIRETDGKDPSLVFRSATGPFSDRDYALFVFDHERLTIGSGNASGVEATLAGNGPELPETEAQAHELRWVPRISKLRPGAAGFDSATFLEKDLRPRAQGDLLLAGTVVFESGRLGVSDVTRDRESDKIIRYEFRAPSGGEVVHSQAIYHHIVAEDEIEPDSLELCFSGRHSQATVVLDAMNDRYDVTIANLELHSMLNVASETAPGAGADQDFAVFYLYSTEPSAGAGYPIPHEPPGIGGGGVFCRSPIFDGLA